MTSEEHGNDFYRIVITAGYGFLLAACFKAVFLARRNSDGRPYTYKQIAIELFGAGAVGALTSWLLDSFHVNHELASVIVAMAGYIGGPILDMAHREVQETIQSAFDGFQKWLNEGKWDKRN